MRLYKEVIEQIALEHKDRAERIQKHPASEEIQREVMAADIKLLATIYGKTFIQIRLDIKEEQEKQQAKQEKAKQMQEFFKKIENETK